MVNKELKVFPYSLRPAKQSDAPYLIATLMTQLHEHYLKKFPMAVASFFLRPAINLLLGSCRVIIIRDTEYPDLHLGFAIYSLPDDKVVKVPTLFYIYVKNTYRKNGIAGDVVRKIFQNEPFQAALISSVGYQYLSKWNATLDPSGLSCLTGGKK